MAIVENNPELTLRSKAEMKLLLYGLTPSKAHDERVRAYGTLHGLLEQIGCIPKNLQNVLKTLWFIIQQDIVSSNEEIAVHSLRVLGIILRFAKLTDSVACNFLNTVLVLITTTSRKRICTLGLRCISMQELSRPLLVKHLKMMVESIVHGIDNPLGSVSITHEAFQAVTQLTKQLPREMREHSASWAPPLYHKILNWKTSELAEKCLSDVQDVVLPPIPKLMEAVMTEIQLRLVTKMKSLVEGDEREAVSAVRAWSWLVKCLGEKVLDEKNLMNEMLQIVQTSFTSTYAQVRNATQIAWVSMIDAFVPSRKTVCPTEMVEAAKPPSRADQSSRKRLKLLMTPLITTFSWEKVTTVQRNCCCTWIHLLYRLGVRVNECSEFVTAVFPMLETVFQLGPKRIDGLVWATCVDVFRSISARDNSASPSPRKGVHTPVLVLGHSQTTPVEEAYWSLLSGAHQGLGIDWSPWGLDRLDSLLRLFRLLWSQGVAQFEAAAQMLAEECNFDTAVGCWRLLVQGVKEEEKGSVRPSAAHVTAVHLLLNSFSWVCKSCPSQGIPSAVWQLVEILIEVLQPVILTSSFYKVQPPWEALARYITEKLTGSVPLEETILDMVTPVVYISAVWLDFNLGYELGAEAEDILLTRVKFVITTARSGFDVMGTFHGLAMMLDCCGKGFSSAQEDNPGTNMHSVRGGSAKIHSIKGGSVYRNWGSVLNVWRTVADQLSEYVDRAGDVPSVPGAGDADYTVAWTLLLFPVIFFVRLSLLEYHDSRAEETENVVPRPCKGKLAVSETQLLCTESTWFRLYDLVSRISSCKPAASNAFVGGFFKRILKVLKHVLHEEPRGHSSISVSSQCLRLIGDVVVHALKYAEVPNFALLAISRKRRKTGFGASSVRVQYLAGVESEDASHLRYLLFVASKLLTLYFENLKSGEIYISDIDVVIRIFEALAGIAQQTTSQNDALLLLKALSQPFTRWLGIGVEGREKDHVIGVIPGLLEDALSQAWDGLLSCLQACHPGLTYDSALLDIQAPTLSIALLHTHGPIADRTLSFWEAAYGSKGYPLTYPSALVEAFCKIRQEVEVSLPGWTIGIAVVKQKFGGVYSRHPLAKFMPQNASREQHLCFDVREDIPCRNLVETNLLPLGPCSGPAGGMSKGTVGTTRLQDVECTLEDANISNFVQAHKSGVQEREYLASGVEEVSTPPSSSKGEILLEEGSFEDFMSIVNSALKKIPAEAISNSSPEKTVTDDSEARMDDGRGRPSKDVILHSDEGKPSPDDRTMSLDNVQESQRVINTGNEDVSGDPLSCTSALITPPVTSVDSPLSPPTILAGGERNVYLTHATLSFEPSGSPLGSKLPRRRKRLKFHDDAVDIELSGALLSLHERTIVPLVDNNCTEIQNLQEHELMENASVLVGNVQSCNYVLNSPDDVTEMEDFAVSCKENLPSNIPQNLDIVALSSSKQTEVAEPLGCPNCNDSSARLRSSIRYELDLPQMKERLTALYRLHPTLRFREIVRSEQYSALPREVLIKLKKHVNELKTLSKLNDLDTAANGQGLVGPGQGVMLHYEKEKFRVTVDAVNQSHAQSDCGQQFAREDVNTAPLEEQEAESQELPGGEDQATLCRRGLYGHKRSRLPPGRRIADVLVVPRRKSVDLRSSWELRGRKQRWGNAEADRACTLRHGSKEVGVRKRRSLHSNSIPHKEERIDSARLPEKVFKGDFVVEKAQVPKVPDVKPAGSDKDSVWKDYLQYEDSGFRIRELHRGLFDTSYVTEVVGPRNQSGESLEALENVTPLSHSRKCKIPKRVNRTPCKDGYRNGTTVVVTEAVDSLYSVPPGETFSNLRTSKQDDVLHRLHTQVIPSAGGLASLEDEHFRHQGFSLYRHSEDENTEDSPNTDIPICPLRDIRSQADCSLALSILSNENEAEQWNNSESPLIPTKHKELNGEIKRLLHSEGVRVNDILAALAASPELTSLAVAEIVEAEKLICEISQVLQKRKQRSESMFTQPTKNLLVKR